MKFQEKRKHKKKKESFEKKGLLRRRLLAAVEGSGEGAGFRIWGGKGKILKGNTKNEKPRGTIGKTGGRVDGNTRRSGKSKKTTGEKGTSKAYAPVPKKKKRRPRLADPWGEEKHRKIEGSRICQKKGWGVARKRVRAEKHRRKIKPARRGFKKKGKKKPICKRQKLAGAKRGGKRMKRNGGG